MILIKAEVPGDTVSTFLVPSLVLMARDGVSGHTLFSSISLTLCVKLG